MLQQEALSDAAQNINRKKVILELFGFDDHLSTRVLGSLSAGCLVGWSGFRCTYTLRWGFWKKKVPWRWRLNAMASVVGSLWTFPVDPVSPSSLFANTQFPSIGREIRDSDIDSDWHYTTKCRARPLSPVPWSDAFASVVCLIGAFVTPYAFEWLEWTNLQFC